MCLNLGLYGLGKVGFVGEVIQQPLGVAKVIDSYTAGIAKISYAN